MNHTRKSTEDIFNVLKLRLRPFWMRTGMVSGSVDLYNYKLPRLTVLCHTRCFDIHKINLICQFFSSYDWIDVYKRQGLSDTHTAGWPDVNF